MLTYLGVVLIERSLKNLCSEQKHAIRIVYNKTKFEYTKKLSSEFIIWNYNMELFRRGLFEKY